MFRLTLPFSGQFPLLSLIIWLPIIAGLFLLLLHHLFKINKKILIVISKVVSIISLMLCLKLFLDFSIDEESMQFRETHSWLKALGINYDLGVDGFSVPLAMLSCFMTFFVIFLSDSIKRKIVEYLAAFLILQGALCGIFFSLDVILFYIFFESMLIPMFLIIGIWGGNNRVYASIKFFLYTLLGSLFLLISFLYLHFASRSLGYPINETFSVLTFHNLHLSLQEQQWLFWGLLLAFAIKVPIWPLHTWLPDAHVEAPTGGSVMLASVILKVGGYGILRFVLPIVPNAGLLWHSEVVIILSLIAICYISLVTLAQKNIKKLIAYSSIVHMGFVTLGLFVVFSLIKRSLHEQVDILNAVMGIQGAYVQMISHGFIAGALFLCVGILYDRFKVKEIKDYGGVANRMPLFATLFMIFSMANIGLPGTSGFVGEAVVIFSAFQSKFIYAILAASVLILGASYTLWLYKRVMFGEIKNQGNKEITKASLIDLNYKEVIMLSILAFVILLFGIWPQPIFQITYTAAGALISNISQIVTIN